MIKKKKKKVDKIESTGRYSGKSFWSWPFYLFCSLSRGKESLQDVEFQIAYLVSILSQPSDWWV
jgi:hypothetical protein